VNRRENSAFILVVLVINAHSGNTTVFVTDASDVFGAAQTISPSACERAIKRLNGSQSDQYKSRLGRCEQATLGTTRAPGAVT